MSLIVSPKSECYELLLTGITPTSHHDPAIQDKSNRNLFNRQKQIMARVGEMVLPDAALMRRIAQTHPVPIDIAAIVQDLAFPEFVATVLARLFMDTYNSLSGTGLFSGMERYAMLEARLSQAAVVSPNLRQWWDRLCAIMQVPIHAGEHDLALLDLLTLPSGAQQLVLRALAKDYRSVVAIARLWHSTAKLESEKYAAAVGKEAMVQPKQVLEWEVAALAESATQVLEVPAVSSNSIRHQVVREPAWLHLCQHLGIHEAVPGKGPVPSGVEAIFYNGGNIEAGAKQPSNTFSLAHTIRATYPSLDLLGGVTDSFDVGESRLKVAAWVVCRENRDALTGSPAAALPAARTSIYDLLDDVTLTRQAGQVDSGQMIFSFETLCKGLQVVCRLSLAPFTPPLTRGALFAAVSTYLDNDATIGGQAARGFGWCTGQWLQAPPTTEYVAEYEQYLANNKEILRIGLCDGTLGTGAKVLS